MDYITPLSTLACGDTVYTGPLKQPHITAGLLTRMCVRTPYISPLYIAPMKQPRDPVMEDPHRVTMLAQQSG